MSSWRCWGVLRTPRSSAEHRARVSHAGQCDRADSTEKDKGKEHFNSESPSDVHNCMLSNYIFHLKALHKHGGQETKSKTLQFCSSFLGLFIKKIKWGKIENGQKPSKMFIIVCNFYKQRSIKM